MKKSLNKRIQYNKHDALTQSEHFTLGVCRPGIADLLVGALLRHDEIGTLFPASSGRVKDHRFVCRVIIQHNALASYQRQAIVAQRDTLPLILRRRWAAIGQQAGHAELHIYLKLSPPVLRRGEGVALAGVAVVVGVEPDDLVPASLHGGQFEVLDGRRRRLGGVLEVVGPAVQYGHLDAFVVLDGALEEVVEVGVAVSGHASRDAGVVAEALGRAGQALAAAGVVRQASLGLEAALVDEAGLVDEGCVEALAAVLGRELVLGGGW